MNPSNQKRRRDSEDPVWVEALADFEMGYPEQQGKRHHLRETDEAGERLRQLEMQISGLSYQLQDLGERHERCILENQRLQNRNQQLLGEVRDDYRVAQALRANQQLRAGAIKLLQHVNQNLSNEGVSRREIQEDVNRLWTLFRGG
jgi:regulator of replication initiation timing